MKSKNVCGVYGMRTLNEAPLSGGEDVRASSVPRPRVFQVIVLLVVDVRVKRMNALACSDAGSELCGQVSGREGREDSVGSGLLAVDCWMR